MTSNTMLIACFSLGTVAAFFASVSRLPWSVRGSRADERNAQVLSGCPSRSRACQWFQQLVSIHKIPHPKYLGRHVGRDVWPTNISFSTTSFFSSVGCFVLGFRYPRTTATNKEKERRRKKTPFRIFAVCKPKESSNSGLLTGQLGEWINIFSFSPFSSQQFFLFCMYVFVLAVVIVSINSCLVVERNNPPLTPTLCCT